MTIEEKQAKIKEYCNTIAHCVYCALYHSEFYVDCIGSCYVTKSCKKIDDMFNYLRDKGLITIPQEKQCCDYNSGYLVVKGQAYEYVTNILNHNGYNTEVLTHPIEYGQKLADVTRTIKYWKSDNNIDDAMRYQE